jgi:hypothetical protein
MGFSYRSHFSVFFPGIFFGDLLCCLVAVGYTCLELSKVGTWHYLDGNLWSIINAFR